MRVTCDTRTPSRRLRQVTSRSSPARRRIDLEFFANELIDPRTHKRQSSLRDAELRAIDPSGPEAHAGIGLGTLHAETIADDLRAHAPHATIIAISLNDRGAVFACGHHPDAAIWYEPRSDAFITSSAFANSFPAWAKFIDDGAIQKLREDPWTLLDPVFVSSHAKQPDAQTGESEVFGFGKTFPHSFATARIPPIAFRASPRGDDAVLMLATAAIDQRKPSEPMLLAISLSSYDYVNHFYGPDSWEAWDELLRLDRALAKFFGVLDQKVGAENWSLVLSGDHGGPPLPEAPDAARPWCAKGEESDFWQRPCRKTGRIFPDAVEEAARDAAKKALGAGDWILGVASPYVFYTQSATDLPADRRKKLDDAVTKALLANPEIDRVYGAPTSPCPPESEEGGTSQTATIDALACRSLSPTNKSALFFMEKKGSFVDTDYDLGKGMSHGGPYLFDRSVPLIVRAPHRVHGGVTIQEPIGFGAYVRSLAALLGVPAPKDASDAKEIVPRVTP